MSILAIDPGPEKSAWVLYAPSLRRPITFGIDYSNLVLRDKWRHAMLLPFAHAWEATAIEMVACYGMPVGREVFETALWVGRYIERSPVPSELIYRRECKLSICKDSRAKDANIRAGLLNRWGGKPAIGTKKAPGPLYGVSKDVWAALAVAVTYSIKHGMEPEIV